MKKNGVQSSKVRAIGWETAKSDAVRCFNVLGTVLAARHQPSGMPTIETVVFKTPQSCFQLDEAKGIIFLQKNVVLFSKRCIFVKK